MTATRFLRTVGAGAAACWGKAMEPNNKIARTQEENRDMTTPFGDPTNWLEYGLQRRRPQGPPRTQGISFECPKWNRGPAGRDYASDSLQGQGFIGYCMNFPQFGAMANER